MISPTCHCGKSIVTRIARRGIGQCCSLECRAKAPGPPEGTFKCKQCQRRIPSGDFHWYRDSRYNTGWRRFPLCVKCGRERSRIYHAEHRDADRTQHAKWRRLNLSGSNPHSLRFWFARQLGSYRKRARDLNIPFDLSVDDLTTLYLIQDGKCYYTNETLSWGHSKLSPNSLSLDRRNPKNGYVTGNVALCLFHINTMKGARTEAEFFAECERILEVRARSESCK